MGPGKGLTPKRSWITMMATEGLLPVMYAALSPRVPVVPDGEPSQAKPLRQHGSMLIVL